MDLIHILSLNQKKITANNKANTQQFFFNVKLYNNIKQTINTN